MIPNNAESANHEKEKSHMYDMEESLLDDVNGNARKSIIQLLNQEAFTFKSKPNLSQEEKNYIESLEIGASIVDTFWKINHEEQAIS